MLLISSVSCITQQVFLQPEYEKNKFRHFMIIIRHFMIIKIQHEKLSTALCAGKLHIFHWFSYSWNDWFRSYYFTLCFNYIAHGLYGQVKVNNQNYYTMHRLIDFIAWTAFTISLFFIIHGFIITHLVRKNRFFISWW